MSFIPKRRLPFRGQLSGQEKQWLYDLTANVMAGKRLSAPEQKVFDEYAAKRFADLVGEYKHKLYHLPPAELDELEWYAHYLGLAPYKLPVAPWERPTGPSFEQLAEQEEQRQQRLQRERESQAAARESAASMARAQAYLQSLGLR